ncbi:sugar phosphate isomerase/epimerase family protein [Thermococcus thioreducens]|uniref:AP endonuclease n=1 Tax=Thermococcus thioreducens TaxID=277988 RepID=A0A0Q2RG06_9EURY|nr:sugar phosphate isomerase/epimerase family protein [Thermococcus thioreducens]ASJ12211.1 AP endonuclease [Thermococcus thioreducens]KQH82950.1 AP endonuclease [Thermococcus thioreducens]SEV94822.1 Sugar phosphate isomerase/epimerase [Thermococcus thioreducens]
MRLGVTSSLVKEISGKGLSLDELKVPLVEIYLDEVPILIGTSVDWSLVKNLSGLGVRFTIHAPTHVGRFSSIDLGKRSRLNIKVMERVFQVASSLNAEKIVVHGGSVEKSYHMAYLNTKRTLNEICKMSEETGTGLVLENLFGSSVGVLPYELTTLLNENLNACLDTGHAFLAAMELGLSMDEFTLLAPYVDHAHVHDNNGTKDEHLPPGKGLLGKTFIRKLLRAVEPSTAILEIRNYHSPDEILESIHCFEKIKKAEVIE